MTHLSRIALTLTMLFILPLTSVFPQTQTKSKPYILQKDADGTEWSSDLSEVYYTGNIIASVIAITPPRYGFGFILELDCSDGTARIRKAFTYDGYTKRFKDEAVTEGWYTADGVTLKLMRVVCKMDKSKMKRSSSSSQLPDYPASRID